MALSIAKRELFDDFFYRSAKVYSINKHRAKDNDWIGKFKEDNDFGRLKTLRLLYLAWLEPNFPEKSFFSFGPYGDFDFIESDIIDNYSMFENLENERQKIKFSEKSADLIEKEYQFKDEYSHLDVVIDSLHRKGYLTNSAFGLKEAILYDTTYFTKPRLYVKNIDY